MNNAVSESDRHTRKRSKCIRKQRTLIPSSNHLVGPHHGRTPFLATTPTGYGRFIGRVGALAVALGIGAAIANSPGIAWAQDGPSGASDTSSGGAGASNAGSTTGASGSADSSASGSKNDSDPSGD